MIDKVLPTLSSAMPPTAWSHAESFACRAGPIIRSITRELPASVQVQFRPRPCRNARGACNFPRRTAINCRPCTLTGAAWQTVGLTLCVCAVSLGLCNCHNWWVVFIIVTRVQRHAAHTADGVGYFFSQDIEKSSTQHSSFTLRPDATCITSESVSPTSYR